jgi:hypothetical protein
MQSFARGYPQNCPESPDLFCESTPPHHSLDERCQGDRNGDSPRDVEKSKQRNLAPNSVLEGRMRKSMYSLSMRRRGQQGSAGP